MEITSLGKRFRCNSVESIYSKNDEFSSNLDQCVLLTVSSTDPKLFQ